jgi:plastocyanin
MSKASVTGAVVALVGSLVLFMAPDAKAAHEVVVRDQTFNPQEEVVGAGDTVIWVHDDGANAHSVTADDGSFDSHPGCSAAAPADCMAAGQTFKFKFDKVGRYPYHSKPHGAAGGEGMSGVIVVVKKGSGSGTTSTTG